MQSKAAFSTLDRLRVFQMVNRVWRPHLSQAERDLLFYLVDRTVSWGTDCVRTTIGQLVEGSSWATSTGMSRASIFRTIKSLRERGILATTFDGRASVFTLNVLWEPDMSLPTPKRLKKQDAASPFSDLFLRPETDEIERLLAEENGEEPVSICDGSSLNLRPQQSQFETPYNNTPSNVETPNPLTGVVAEGQQEISYRVRTRSTAKEAISAVQAKPTRKVARPIWSVWHDAWNAAFPNVPCVAWSKADMGMISRVTQRAKQSRIEPSLFIEFCVTHWSEIMAREFSWMTQSPPPAYPRVSFLATAKFIEKFLDRFAATQTQQRLSTDLSKDAEIERMMLTGMSYEDALIEYGKRKGVSEQRREFQQRERQLALQAKANQRSNKPMPAKPAKPQPRLITPVDNHYETGVDMPDFTGLTWDD